MHSSSMFSYPRQDLVAGIVVFLIALPLCLGIAIACGVPPLSGLVAGVVGGIIVPLWSRSPLSVTGPAAVIKGMLASIGITIILKQLPVALGVSGGLTDIPSRFHTGAALITLASLIVLYGWKRTPLAKLQVLPPALVVVFLGGLLAAAFADNPTLALSRELFVDVPLGGFGALFAALPKPDLTVLGSGAVWSAALTIAIVASIETLLSCQAVDRLDPLQRHTPPDRELVAQGAGNLIAGALGGLPVTSVIVRSGANVAAGGRERLSALVHGVLLLLAVLFLGSILNQVPLACLAAVLIQVGLNLCKPALFTEQQKLGWSQFLPFGITIGAILALDLLKGVIIGIVAGIFFVLRQYALGALERRVSEDGTHHLRFHRDGTFMIKPALMTALDDLDDDIRVVIDGSGVYVDQDIKEALASFLEDAHTRRIEAKIVGIDMAGVHAGGGH